MKSSILTALRVTLVTWVLTGLLYPLTVTAMAQGLFADAANGSLLHNAKGQVQGSALIGQSMQRDAYFQPRPSAASYDGAASTGSNLGPTSRALRERSLATLQQLQRDNPAAPGPVPIELLAASGSGLDPEISPAAALWQVPRVAQARGFTQERVRALVTTSTEGRTWGFVGEPRVNVLQLNLRLDRQFGIPSALGAAVLSDAPRMARE